MSSLFYQQTNIPLLLSICGSFHKHFIFIFWKNKIVLSCTKLYIFILLLLDICNRRKLYLEKKIKKKIQIVKLIHYPLKKLYANCPKHRFQSVLSAVIYLNVCFLLLSNPNVKEIKQHYSASQFLALLPYF